MRKPRLNSAVATVAVETVLSLLRVVSLSLVIAQSLLSFRDGPRDRARERRLINRRLTDGRAESGLEEIEIAAFVRLLDVTGEHPAIAAFEATLGRLPCGAAAGKLRFRDIEGDGARGDIKRD